jgi:spermidine synthase
VTRGRLSCSFQTTFKAEMRAVKRVCGCRVALGKSASQPARRTDHEPSERVKRIERLDEALAPDGTVLTLYRRDGAYWIQAGGEDLMSTRRYHSEEKLAELVCLPYQQSERPRVLIGGLGLGFTLRAALRVLPPDARIVIVEIVEKVIEWNRNRDYPLAADALADPRVELRHDDVAAVLRASRGEFDAIMLDVDNGAQALTTDSNAQLYGERGVRNAVKALRPGGRLAYWSADEDPRFAAHLRRVGLSVESVRVRAHATSGGSHTLLLARELSSLSNKDRGPHRSRGTPGRPGEPGDRR